MRDWIIFRKKSEQILIQSSSWRITLWDLEFNCLSRSNQGKIKHIEKSIESYTKWNYWKQSRIKKKLRGPFEGKNLRVDRIEENENETWKDTENKLIPFLHDELEITDELYIARAHRIWRRECLNANSNSTPRAIVPRLHVS